MVRIVVVTTRSPELGVAVLTGEDLEVCLVDLSLFSFVGGFCLLWCQFGGLSLLQIVEEAGRCCADLVGA